MRNIVHHCSCMELMEELPENYFDLAIVDPPYGKNIETSGTWMKKAFKNKKFDERIPDKKYFQKLLTISKDQIIWGGNYFTKFLEPNNNWILWHKMNDGMSFSMVEMAWYSKKYKTRLFTLMNNGVKKSHPTQKPVALYKWLLTNYAKPGQTIFDSHVGSGSSRIACYDMGFEFVGAELDLDYWEAQEQRFQNHIKQADLFTPAERQEMIYKEQELF